MKFGQSLLEHQVPEWRYQYLNYKGGKKRLKKLRKAGSGYFSRPGPQGTDGTTDDPLSLRHLNVNIGSPAVVARRISNYLQDKSNQASLNERTPILQAEPSSSEAPEDGEGQSQDHDHGNPSPVEISRGKMFRSEPASVYSRSHALQDKESRNQRGITPNDLLNSPAPSPAMNIPPRRVDKPESPAESYGSIVPTPPTGSSYINNFSGSHAESQRPRARKNKPVSSPFSIREEDEETGTPLSQYRQNRSLGRPYTNRRPSARFSGGYQIQAKNKDGTTTEQDLDQMESFFFDWLDQQLQKVCKFYTEKEKECSARLEIIRQQLHFLRDQRLYEKARVAIKANTGVNGENGTGAEGQANKKVDAIHPKKVKKNLENGVFASENILAQVSSHLIEQHGDYEARTFKVPYRVAKQKLKAAIGEYYRELELLKAYQSMNLEGFRKICKKFDKVTGKKASPWFMEKVRSSYVGRSEAVDNMIAQTEDLFARYFEKGSRKRATTALRISHQEESHTLEVYLSGLFLGASLPFFCEGLANGVSKTNMGVLPGGSALIQIWAGFFLLNLTFLLMAALFFIMNHYRISYQFIFEFDPRTVLDAKQYPLMPSMSFFWMCLWGWISFSDFWPTVASPTWCPLIYICTTVTVFALPLPIFYWHSRKWMLIALWRLLCSGIYPVVFQDLIMGDVTSSLTYSTGNLPMFFCLFANGWPWQKCGSGRSRVLGFFQTLPSIFRFFQCVRRFLDTGDWFPHLANCLKYSFGILCYCFLSVWRIDKTSQGKACYITFALLNAMYSSFWDVFMDWSLFQPKSKYLFLRSELGYHNPYFYYVAMIIDPILRFNWIFYAIYPQNIQQSISLSFFVSLAELLRRMLWVLFRIDNEHCANVRLFKASREMPLPYNLNEEERPSAQAESFAGQRKNTIRPSLLDRLFKHEATPAESPNTVQTNNTEAQNFVPNRPEMNIPYHDEEQPRTIDHLTAQEQGRAGHKPSPAPSVTASPHVFLSTIANAMNRAHTQDFQRKRSRSVSSKDSDEDDDEDDDESKKSVASASGDEALGDNDQSIDGSDDQGLPNQDEHMDLGDSSSLGLQGLPDDTEDSKSDDH